MPERWRRTLGALDRVEPDVAKMKETAALGPCSPDPPERARTRVLAAVVAFVVAGGALAFVVSAFDGGTEQVSSSLDPASICDVPVYDPDVALLVGQPVREVPLADLEGPGQGVADLEGAAADEVRAYVTSDAGRNAPHDGWRQVAVPGDEVVYVAPHEVGWWILGFTQQPDGDWRRSEEEIVEQAQTPAQRGHGLALGWDGPLVVDGGRWNDPLRLTNERDEGWAEEGSAHWGFVHVFAEGSTEEIGGGARIAPAWGASYGVNAGGSTSIPVALGAHLSVLEPGAYDAVACLPDLGLASPVGTLEVIDPSVVPGVTVMTYPGTTGQEALGGGALSVADGCLTLGDDPGRTTHVLWPNGYAFVERDGREVLIDPIGNEVAELGDEMSVGGGWVHLPWAEELVVGGIPDACRVGGESYFVTSGPADAG